MKVNNSASMSNSRKRALVLISLCVLCAGQTWAQQADKKSESPQLQATVVSSNDPTDPVQTASKETSDDSFVIGPDDILAVNVWKEPDISRSVPVRSDGKITLPLVGELQAAGQTPNQLQKEIATRLESYISEPEVTVMVQEVRSQRFNILGQVTKPGSYLLTSSAKVLDAIAMAGGFRDFAKKKSIYVLRSTTGGGQSRLPFNYSEVIKGKKSEQNIELRPRDTVIVP
ncbi:MAG: polysaccharide biosynthesis/export family protein [Terriglobales bacterium]